MMLEKAENQQTNVQSVMNQDNQLWFTISISVREAPSLTIYERDEIFISVIDYKVYQL